MCGGHLLKFLDSHVRHKEGKKMTVNLQRSRVSCNKQYKKKSTDKKKKLKARKYITRQGRHLKKEIFAIVLMCNGYVLFKVPRSNVLD